MNGVIWSDGVERGHARTIESLARELHYDGKTALEIDGEPYFWQDGEIFPAGDESEWTAAFTGVPR